MKTSDKLIEAYDKFRPHINGHKTAMDLFLEALKEVKEMEQELSKLHQPTVIGTLPLCKSCGKGKSFDINYNCFDCGKSFSGNGL